MFCEAEDNWAHILHSTELLSSLTFPLVLFLYFTSFPLQGLTSSLSLQDHLSLLILAGKGVCTSQHNGLRLQI